MASKVPRYLKPYFWDTPLANLDPKKHRIFLIERLLNLGDLKAIQYLFKTYRKTTIKKVLSLSRNLSLKSAQFWALFFGLSKKEVQCLNPVYRSKHVAIWTR